MGATKVDFTTWYKPGGTLQLSVGDISGQITSSYHDPLGRWVSQTLKGKDGIQITIISAYQVVTDNTQLGATTATAQQRSQLTQMNASNRNPRQAFKMDLQQFLR
jgi:hypothetical protein